MTTMTRITGIGCKPVRLKSLPSTFERGVGGEGRTMPDADGATGVFYCTNHYSGHFNDRSEFFFLIS